MKYFGNYILLLLGILNAVHAEILLGLQYECGLFCSYYKRINLITLDTITAKPTFVANIIPWAYESYIDSLYITTCFDDDTNTYFVVASDRTIATLYMYTTAHGLQSFEIPAQFKYENLSNIFYYQEEGHLLANYGKEMVRILADRKLEHLTTLWDPEDVPLFSGNITTIDQVNKKLYIEAIQPAARNRPGCTYILEVDLVGSRGYHRIRSPCFLLSNWAEDPFLYLMAPHYSDGLVVTFWGGNLGRVGLTNVTTGQFFSKFDKKDFSNNYWSTKFFRYTGTKAAAYNSNTNTLFVVLRETKPFDLEDLLIGRIDLQTGSSDQSNYLDTSYYTYLHLYVLK